MVSRDLPYPVLHFLSVKTCSKETHRPSFWCDTSSPWQHLFCRSITGVFQCACKTNIAAPMCSSYTCRTSRFVLVADAATTACTSIECSDAECCTLRKPCLVCVSCSLNLSVRWCAVEEAFAGLLFFCLLVAFAGQHFFSHHSFNPMSLWAVFFPFAFLWNFNVCIQHLALVFEFMIRFGFSQRICVPRFCAPLGWPTSPMQKLLNARPAHAWRHNAALAVSFFLSFVGGAEKRFFHFSLVSSGFFQF